MDLRIPGLQTESSAVEEPTDKQHSTALARPAAVARTAPACLSVLQHAPVPTETEGGLTLTMVGGLIVRARALTKRSGPHSAAEVLLPGEPARGQRFRLLRDPDTREFVVMPRIRGGASDEDPETSDAGESLDDAAVLERFGRNMGASTPKGTIQAHQTYLRAFGIWLSQHFPRAGGLAHVEQADQAMVNAVVNQYRDAIGRSSTHGIHINGAIAALRGVSRSGRPRALRSGDRAVLERFGMAARTAGLTVGAIKTYQADLRKLSHWLDERHPDQRGLAGILRGNAQTIETLLQAFQKTNQTHDIGQAVKALRRIAQR